jgi:hypothetical protein
MIRALFSNILARESSRYLTKRRIRKERELIRQVARRMCVETGMKVPLALKD